MHMQEATPSPPGTRTHRMHACAMQRTRKQRAKREEDAKAAAEKQKKKEAAAKANAELDKQVGLFSSASFRLLKVQ